MFANLKNINVLGCGWFGLPMAKFLISKGFSVKGSVTSAEKVGVITGNGIECYLLALTPRLFCPDEETFFAADILLVSISPGKDPENYALKLEELVKAVNNNHIKQVIFISSTSVYGDVNREVRESDELFPETASGIAIAAAERILTAESSFTTTIVRFAGLVGPERHPARFFAGKKCIPNGQSPVNLIHLDDCIGIISSIIEKQAFGKIYNACMPHHPTKQEFYKQAALAGGLPLPEFRDELKSWKRVQDNMVQQYLNYQYKITNWFDWLSQRI